MSEESHKVSASSFPLAVAVGLVAFAAYALAAAPAAYSLDSAELAAATFGLGVAHPPGEETTLLWGRIFCLLPFGTMAFKVALGQAVAGAIAAVLVYYLVLAAGAELAVTSTLRPLVRELLAAAAALAFAFAPGVVIVCDRPEVYATQTALSLGAILVALRANDDRRPLLLAAFLIAIGVGNHSLIAGLVGLGAVTCA